MQGRGTELYGAKVVFIASLVATGINNFVQGNAASLIIFVVARGLAGKNIHLDRLTGKILNL